ncbi:uncharacterized protein LOC121736207 [Aricia agestis]|uniref:uncharacterized protein LOC121736207 n=1 Tax=Aricia agestis TaxID=91739 RepID=UPI001C208776|nr:uncharacterized protein LOC121736207 [Aricia agestis]
MARCVTCDRSLYRGVRRHVLTHHFFDSRRDFVERIFQNLQPLQELAFDGTRSICHPCWHRIEQSLHQRPRTPPIRQVSPSRAAIQVPGFTRAANTSRRCMMESCNNVQLRQMPNSIKVFLLSYYHLYIPPLARICENHLRNTALEDMSQSVSHAQTDFNSGSFGDIVRMYTLALENRCKLNFNNLDEITAEDLHFWTGLNHEEFNSLFDQLPTLSRRSFSAREDLGIYLAKIRTGEPSIRLATLFNKSRQSIDRKIKLARQCLNNDFVPLHLGLDHISRSEIVERNRILPNYIFGDDLWTKALIICDGGYIFIQKSSNFFFQRECYSLHKYTNLIKPFMLVCGDGHILDVAGPYAATASDAVIMRHILENPDGPPEEAPINYYLEQGDTFIVDRGFRDVIPLLESCGYTVHMPPTKRRGETQLTCEEANKSRLVTLCRWVVETINGRFKRDFKMFRYRVFNTALPTVMMDYRIAAALINAFQQPYEDSQYTEQFIETINRNMNRPNLLADYVVERNLNRQRATFVRLEVNDQTFEDFPRLTQEELILFAVGTYHCKIARSYCNLENE